MSKRAAKPPRSSRHRIVTRANLKPGLEHPSAQETWVLFYAYAGWLPYELLDFCQCICGFGAMPIGMLARAIVTELNGIRHVRGSSLFARVDLRHALHHASREVHGGGAPNALQ